MKSLMVWYTFRWQIEKVLGNESDFNANEITQLL